MNRALIFVVAVCVGVTAASCTKVQKGGLIGAAAGAGIGGAWASTAGVLNAGEGAAVGAATGAAGGTLIADALDDGKESEIAKTDNLTEAELENLRAQNEALERALADARTKGADVERDLASKLGERDKQLDDLRRQLEGVQVERTTKGITLTFLSEILFDSGKATIKAQGEEMLNKASAILKEKFPENELSIEGHTDNVPIKYSGYKSNWELSSARALSVVHYLVDKEGFSPDKVSATGYGEFRPVAGNDTPEGRAQNRRAVIVIMPKEIEVARERLDVREQ